MPLVRKPPPQSPPEAVASLPDLASLAAALRAGRTHARFAAARSLAAHAQAVPILAEVAATEADPDVREAVFTALARIGTDASADAAIACLTSPDAGLRMAALDALRAMIGTVRPRLAALLSAPDPGIRLLACDLVRGVPPGEGAALLCALLDRETAPNVCAAAVDVLVEIGGAASLPALARCAARFASVPFLAFALADAQSRLAAGTDDPDG